LDGNLTSADFLRQISSFTTGPSTTTANPQVTLQKFLHYRGTVVAAVSRPKGSLDILKVLPLWTAKLA